MMLAQSSRRTYSNKNKITRFRFRFRFPHHTSNQYSTVHIITFTEHQNSKNKKN